MERSNTFEKVYSDLSGAYMSGTFDFIEEKHNDLWQDIISKENEINDNWDSIADSQFVFMCNSFKRLLLQGIMLRRKYV